MGTFVRRQCLPALALLIALCPVAVATRAQDKPRNDAPRATPTATRPARTKADPNKTEFLRFVDDHKGGGRLESAIATYRNAAGATVHLVAAVHVGEKSFYRGLSDTFKAYDALLYEMVKPRGAAAPAPGEHAGGLVSTFQRFLKDTLELEFQLDAIDYTARNFVHADLDYETFQRLQEERGESLLTLMIRSILDQARRQDEGTAAPPITMFDILAAMSSPDSARQYKLLLARQFNDIEAQLAGVEGDQGTVILTERNKAALNVLKQTLATGKRNVGVFYGAGHMRGLEDALVGDMGFRRVRLEYRTAWDMTATTSATRPAKPAPRPAPHR